jgi:predicted ribosomally synthesized peptide with nif11-like leader
MNETPTQGPYDEPVFANTPRSELLNAFIERARSNDRLQDELRQAETTRDLVEIAARHGFGLQEAEFARLQESDQITLTLSELETVVGMLPCWCDPSVVNSRSCAD